MSLNGKRIFIVEDNIENKAVMQLLLEKAGALVAFDRWGVATVEKALSFMPVDLFLMDLMFPNHEDGYQIADRLRAVPELHAIPIVAVSAADPADEIARAQAHGFSGFIAKPISFHNFVPYIEGVFEGKQVWN